MFLYRLGSAVCSFIEFTSRTECHASINGLCRHLGDLSIISTFSKSISWLFGQQKIYPMLLWPLRVLSRVFLVRAVFD